MNRLSRSKLKMWYGHGCTGRIGSYAYDWKPHFCDVKIYLELCMALQLDSQNPDAFLVTDAHIFFNFFLQSRVISELLQECITQELGTCIPAKLASEVIPGISL